MSVLRFDTLQAAGFVMWGVICGLAFAGVLRRVSRKRKIDWVFLAFLLGAGARVGWIIATHNPVAGGG